MAQNYTRQSSFTDGDTVTAALFNNEYNQLVNAFAYSSSDASSTGHRHDGTAGQGGNVPQIGDLDFLNKVVVDSTNNRVGFFVEVSSSAVEQIRVQDGAIVPVTDNDIDLGTSSLQFKDAFINGTLEADAITIAGVTLAETISDTVGAMVGSNTETGITVTYDDSDNTLDFVIGSGVIVSSMLDTNIDISGVATASTFEPDGDTAAGDNAAIGYTAAEGLILTGQGSTNDVTVKNDADTAVIQIPTGTTNVSIAGDLTVTGDLTVSGDDITMGTNTSGNLLVADGTNFNSIAVSSLSEISSVANDDVFLAIDTSGGGLKKISRSAIVSGLATSSAITSVAGDSTPQLGGDLDVNGNDIVSVSNGNINLLPNGSGKVIIDGNGSSGGVTITDGNIDIRTGTGAVSKIKFYCESSNAHAQTLQAQAHSASSSAVLTLPVATGTLVGSGDSGTVATGMIADDAVTAAKLASSAVVTASIVDDNVTQAKIADDAVGADQLAASAVVTASIVDDNVTQAKIADDAVGADQLAASAVVTASIVDDAITSAKIADDAITSALIADDAVVAAAIADNAVDIARLNVSDGTSGQVLTTNGSGTLSFATVGGAYNSWLVKTSAYTALAGDQIIVNSSSAVTITLPASASAGNTVIIKATGGGTVTIGRNSQKINSTAEDGTLASGSATQLVFVNSTIGFLEI